jgi:hypothetical protein
LKYSLCFIVAFFFIETGTVMAEETETAQYEVIAEDTDQKIEIRRYAPMVLAETPMQNGRNDAFGRLFNYISGANMGEQKIAMTTPVIMDDGPQEGVDIPMTAPVFVGSQSEGMRMMSFVLPLKYNFEKAPKPTNESVILRNVENYNVAAIRFSGFLSDDNISNHLTKLTSWMDENGYQPTGPYRSAGYDAPFTLPWMRRNEVLIPVDLPE